MARRTKQESQATRGSILDAAEQVFLRQGVARTSLQDIAQAAGVTRGAIYWHFRGKAELFSEMLARVTLPLQDPVQAGGPGAGDTGASGTRPSRSGAGDTGAGASAPGAEGSGDPLERIRASFVDAMRRTVEDPQQRRVYEIAAHKAEYVGELLPVRMHYLAGRQARVANVERALEAAIRLGRLPPGTPVRAAALGLHAVVEGLIRNWLLDPEAFELVPIGEQAIDLLLGGMAAGAGFASRAPSQTPPAGT